MMAEKSLPVTVVIPVFQEALRLPNCVEKLSEFASIVVVDSDSRDNTKDIASKCGSVVLEFNWNGKFPKKRNWVLRNYHFRTPWVLFLDADEYVTPEFTKELRQRLETEDKTGYWVRYISHFMGHPLKYGVPQRKLALFRVGSGEYEHIEEDSWSDLDMEIHEHPIIDGPCSEICAPILHDDDRGISAYIAKHNRYSDWEARRFLNLKGNDRAWNGLTVRQKVKYTLIAKAWFGIAYLVVQYICKLGFLDGPAGAQFAICKAIYFYQISIKIKELRGKGH